MTWHPTDANAARCPPADPLLADRLAPQGFGDLICEGYPVVEVSSDGLVLVVDREAPGFDNPEGCDDPRLRLAILPPKSLPWTLTGSVTGFELMLRMGVDLVLEHATGCRDPLPRVHPWYALIELSSQARSGLRAVMEEVLAEGLARTLPYFQGRIR